MPTQMHNQWTDVFSDVHDAIIGNQVSVWIAYRLIPLLPRATCIIRSRETRPSAGDLKWFEVH